MQQLLTVPEAAERLRKSPEFVRGELYKKNLRGHKIGGTWRVTEEALEVYIESLANVPRIRTTRSGRALAHRWDQRR